MAGGNRGQTTTRICRRIHRQGLTLVELLVVLAIISIMLGLLLPAVHAVRERAREIVCKNNLHQLNLAVSHYAETYKSIPEPASLGVVSGWMVEILPFLEQRNLKEAIPDRLPIDRLTTTLVRPPPILRCPQRTTLDGEADGETVWPGHYVLISDTRRESYTLVDAPVMLNIPWVNGPEIQSAALRSSRGPHSGGFYIAHGFQDGVEFLLPSE